MKIIAVATALFLALASATEQANQGEQGELSRYDGGRDRLGRYDYPRRRWGRGRYDGRYPNPNDGGRDFGYSDSCTCSLNGVIDADIARDACDELRATWPNLKFDEGSGSCYDDAGTGLENNGWGAACQNNGPPRDQFNPAYITSTCDSNSPDDYDYGRWY